MLKKVQHHHSVLHLDWTLSSYRTQRCISDCYLYPLQRNQNSVLSLYYCFLSAFPLFCLPSFPVRSLVTETFFNCKHCGQAQITKWHRPKWLPLNIYIYKFSFFFMAKQYSIVYMYHIFFIHSSADGLLGRSHVLVIVNQCCCERTRRRRFNPLG